MRSSPRRSTSIATSVTLLAILLANGASAFECPTTTISRIEPSARDGIASALDQVSAGTTAGSPASDRKIIIAKGEDIPLIIRHKRLDPLSNTSQILAGAYIGDYAADSRDFFALPDDDLVLCLLTPGTEVFLTDDVTHHYATVFEIDYAGDMVTLLDPWAPTSFLLPGRNLAGVAGMVVEREGRSPLLKLKLTEFRSVYRGFIHWFFAEESFTTIEALFPDLASRSDYLFWRYGSIVGSGDVTWGFLAAQLLAEAEKATADPRLSTLSRAASDLYLGMFDGFPNRSDGEQGFVADFPDFARNLSWPVRWTLAKQLGDINRLDLEIPLLRAYLAIDPDDVDFRIELAVRLAQSGELAPAKVELETARRLWRADVKAMIDEPTEQAAVAYYLPHVDDTIAFALFRFRHERMLLLEAEILFLMSGDRSGADALADYMEGRDNIDFILRFPAEILAAFRVESPDSEAAIAQTMGFLATEGREAERLAFFAYEHLNRVTDIGGSPVLAEAIRSSETLAGAICALLHDNEPVAGAVEQNRQSLDDFCTSLLP